MNPAAKLIAAPSFGFLDGISQPAVKDFDSKPDPGQETVRQGVILCGRENDVDVNVVPPKPFVRPPWALDGSFLTLRYLFQLVPEFTNFLKESADPLHGFTADLIGARGMGRWKSVACQCPTRLTVMHILSPTLLTRGCV